ncbi:ribonuclease H-like domain-containing protein [Radiomyces spectabilis]|uniref:ribonuclease H-like domain-containing protein n=1 Tax=Radiomyces spectabilis TaxID=64574 RepID=UPI00221EFAD4|nr:ribonuclease H-like domain-containing protein [Radiomyces spectabilis]KAI8367598.1 ribonuclease H-like domain-containing protein [Radiomyces spectabilis]
MLFGLVAISRRCATAAALYRLPCRNTHTLPSKMINNPLVWIDCEMTGLDIEKDHLIEIAVLITDGDLNIQAEGPELIIHQSKETMDAMNDWCKEHHGASGLTDAVLKSTVTVEDAEKQVLAFLKEHIPASQAPLAGNSVHADKRFLEKEMPDLVRYLHYRIVDVSTIKELTKRWYPDVASGLVKKGAHRALDDIKESIDELKYYRQHVFVTPK